MALHADFDYVLARFHKIRHVEIERQILVEVRTGLLAVHAHAA